MKNKSNVALGVGLGLGLGFPILICIAISIIVFIVIKRQTKPKLSNRLPVTVQRSSQGVTVGQGNRTVTPNPSAPLTQPAFRGESEAETINSILMHPERYSQHNLEQRLNEILDSTPTRATNSNITPTSPPASSSNRNTDPEHISIANPNRGRRSRRPRAQEVTVNDFNSPPPPYIDIVNN